MRGQSGGKASRNSKRKVILALKRTLLLAAFFHPKNFVKFTLKYFNTCTTVK